MKNLKLLLKGFVVGIGGVSPGLSGSILLVGLGLYSKVIYAVSTIFTNFKKNILFLLPILGGMLLGVFTFSRIISYSLSTYELQTRLAFLGLLLGAIPLVYREVSKNNNVKKKHYIIIAVTFVVCFSLFTLGNNTSQMGDLGIFQSFVFGLMAITATIIPGLEAAAFLSTFGLYGHWLDLASLRMVSPEIIIPFLLGVVVGGFVLSKILAFLMKKDYTTTFAVLFGFFLSIIPNILKTTEGELITIGWNTPTYIGFGLLFIGLIIALLFGKVQKLINDDEYEIS